MAAGLPHFAVGWSRCWGRDTFIAFKPILLLTGNYQLAKQVLIQFAQNLRNGLLPNLLDSSNNPRFNNRDACWWFIKAVGDYIDFSQDYNFLTLDIIMKWTSDNQNEHIENQQKGIQKVMKIQDIIQEIFERHYRGISFQEWNAGYKIDQNMRDQGFIIQLKMDHNTGFIRGGNSLNCLTWMDKMGSSQKASNQAKPATSRDGCPIEMTCLLKKALDIVIKLHKSGHYPYTEVCRDNEEFKFGFIKWANLISHNFEKYYWVPSGSHALLQSVTKEDKVQRRGIYRDTIYCTNLQQELLLRPNACIGIAVAPELFDKKHCFQYLNQVQKYLIEQKSIGIKTLDPNSKYYTGFYDNKDDSHHFNIAHGYSYHNGPEWVWVYGFFVQALVQLQNKIHSELKAKPINHMPLLGLVQNQLQFIRQDRWLSLPEITNQNGSHNHHGCPSQAWSISTFLDACYQIHN